MSEENYCGADEMTLVPDDAATHEEVSEGKASIAVLPLGPRVIVEKLKEAGVSEGGIFIPETQEDRNPRKQRKITLSRGRVISVGTLEETIMPQVGDIVVYADQTAIQLRLNGITYGDVLYEDDIIAIMDD